MIRQFFARARHSLDARARRTYDAWRKRVRQQRFAADHVGRRAVGWQRVSPDGPVFEKRLDRGTTGEQALAREVLARSVFGDRSWMTPVISRDANRIVLPAWPAETRLDLIAPRLKRSARAQVALQAMETLLEMFLEGYAHRDFHGKNLFWVDGQLRVVDFEAIGTYPTSQRPAFPRSYDVAGEGMSAPYGMPHEFFGRTDSPVSLAPLLGVTTADALAMLEERLKEDLWHASSTFQARARRHSCSASRIYNSFALPFLTVEPTEAQRDSGRRMRRFGITPERVQGRTVLDLGSNIGGMLFELQQFGPASCLGVEYDEEKVRIASTVAAYNALHTVRFRRGDIDQLEADAIGAPFDIVFCLAIVEHVQHPARLFELLGRVTARDLYFEGNAGTDRAEVERRLRAAGFRDVKFLGMSDDDCRAENNCRPLWHATK